MDFFDDLYKEETQGKTYKNALQYYFTKEFGKFNKKFNELPLYKKPKKEKETLTKEEWSRLKEILPEKFKFLFQVLNNSGLRIDELLNLQVENITFEGKSKGKIFVRKGKGNKERNTTVLDDFADEIHDYVKDLSGKDFLFTTRSRKPYKSGQSLNQTLTHYCKQLDPPIEKKITNHSYRHMFATDTIEKCGMNTASFFMGHAY